MTGNAYGSAYSIMNSQGLGADITFAWTGAKIGMMDAKLAAGIMYGAKSADEQAEMAAQYDEKQQSAEAAAERGYVDTVIDPADTRKMVIGALEMLWSKQDDTPAKKHGTV